MVEEMEKSENHGKIKEEIKARVRSDDDEREALEDGEIVGGDDTSSAAKPTPATKITHPLEHSWTFWFDNPSAKSRQAAWGSSIRPIYTFSSIEDFWSLYNNIHHPSKLTLGADFHCFKNQIEPKWEDAVCANGGKWTATFQKGKSDTAWLYTLLAMIGEQFDHGDEICGAVVNVRARQEKIALWTRNAANEAAQPTSGKTVDFLFLGSNYVPDLRLDGYYFNHDKFIHDSRLSIGKQWKEFLDYKDTIGFIFHEDAKKLDRGAKNKYTA